MHALNNAAPVIVNRSLTPLSAIRPGEHFIRLDSPSEVLVLMSYAGSDAREGEAVWAVVIAVNRDSEGYIPGQLLKLKRSTHMRRVHQLHASVFALEH